MLEKIQGKDGGAVGARVISYRPEIDGLRAVSVIAVIAFHAFPHTLPGGFLGVDVFFVISGYLITGLIAKKIEAGSFSFLEFYGRRIRRIFPALILVLSFVMACGFALLWTAQMLQLGWHVFGAALFLPNIFLWMETGYFDAAAQSKPLLHLWSLGVEEQFYIVWPAVIWLISTRKWSLKLILSAITVISFAYSLHLSHADPTAAFYSPLCRAWELSFGGLMARTVFENRPIARTATAAVGMTAIVCSFVFVQGFSILGVLPAVMGSGLILGAGSDNGVAKRLLSMQPAVAIGLISYPLYLWHWPLLTFARIENPRPSSFLLLLLITASMVLATLTFIIVERPIQKRVSPRKASIFLISAMALVGGAGFATSRVDWRTLLYPADVQAVLKYANYDFISDARVGECWIATNKPVQKFSSACEVPAHWQGRKIAIWGDSHSGRLYPGLRQTAPKNLAIGEYVSNGCPPIETYNNGYCAAANRQALAALIREKPETVILFAYWRFYTDKYDAGPMNAGLNSFIDKLESNGIKVAIIGPFPSFPDVLPKVIFDEWEANKSKGVPTRIANLPDARVIRVNAQLQALAKRRHLSFFSLIDLLCNAQGCRTTWSSNPGDLITWDYGHLTTGGGRHVGSAVLKALSLD